MANLILASLLLTSIITTNAVSVTTVDEPLAGSYSSLWDLAPLCKEKRFKVNAVCYGATQNEKNCLESLKTGLPLMASGATPSFFPMNEMERERCFETVLDYNCRKVSGEKKRKIVSQVATTIGRPWPPQFETGFKRITPFNLEALMKYDVDLAAPDSEFVYDLPQLNYESGSQTLLVSVQVKLHTFQLHLNELSKRSERVTQAYAKLPSNIQGNVKDYFRFISKFGTHFRYYAIMGGRWITMFSPITYSQFAKLNTWKNNMEEGQASLYLLVKGSFKQEFSLAFEDKWKWETQAKTLFHGGSITEQGYDRSDMQKQYDKWLDSVYDNPSPLYSKFIPLNDFLNGGDLAKYNSIGTVIKYEEAHNEVKKRRFQLNLSERNSLGDYLKTLMEKQLQYICVSPGLQQILQGMVDEKNFKMTKLGLKLKTQTFCDKQKTTCRRKAYKLPLSPGICFNFSLKLKNITDVKIIFPKDTNCFSIYQEKNCKGNRVDLMTKEEIKKEINSAASISFCPFCLKEGLQGYLERTEKPEFGVHPLTIQKTPPVATLTVNNLNNELKQKMMKMKAFNLGI